MNGTKGDHPWTDMWFHGEHPYPADMEAMIRELEELQPGFFTNITRSTLKEYDYWQQCIKDWSRGEKLDEGRKTLTTAVEHFRKLKQ